MLKIFKRRKNSSNRTNVKRLSEGIIWVLVLIMAMNLYNIGLTGFLSLDILMIIVAIGIPLYIRFYFVGVQYEVFDYSEVNFKKIIKEALQASGFDEVSFIETGSSKKIEIRFAKGFKKIQLESIKRFPSGEPLVLISFKRWHNGTVREGIVDKIEAALSGRVPPAKKKWVVVVKAIFAVVILMGILITSNNAYVRTLESNIYPGDGLPDRLAITRLDRNISEIKNHKIIQITDAEAISLFYEPYKAAEVHFIKGVDLSRSSLKYYYEIELADPWKTLYIGTSQSYLRVDYKVMMEKSGWKRPFVWLQQIFSGDRYATYYVDLDLEFDEQRRVEKILENQ